MRPHRMLILALVLLPSVATAQKVTLRLNPPVGKSYAYRMLTQSSTKMGTMDMGMAISETMTLKVLSNAGGKIDMQTKLTDVRVTAPPNSPMKANVAQMQKSMEGMESTTVFDNRYHPFTAKSTSGNSMVQMMMQGMSGAIGGTATFPAGPVGVGSKWTSSMDMGKLMGKAMTGMRMTGIIPITMRLVRFVNVGGKKCAEIAMTMAGTINMAMPGPHGTKGMSVDTKVNETSTMVFDVATGIAQRVASTTVSTAAFGGQGSVSTQKMTMTLK